MLVLDILTRWFDMCIHCEMINGHELGQTLGDSEGRGSLVCCSARGCKESDTTEQMNNSNDSEVLTMMSLGTICPQGSYNTIDHNSLCCVSHPHDLLYNWRFVPLNPLHLFHPPPHPPCSDSQPFILFISESVFILFVCFLGSTEVRLCDIWLFSLGRKWVLHPHFVVLLNPQ